MAITRPPHQRVARRLGPARFAVLAVAAALFLAACTAGSDDGGSDSQAASEGTARKDTAHNASDAADSASSTSKLPTGALDQRAIERHGSLALRSEHVDRARETVVAAAKRAGGYAGSEHSRTGDDGALARTRLQLVVPTDEFDATMDAAADTGTVESRKQTAKDVTDEVVDVDSRVTSAQASLRRVRLLLGRAGSLGDVIRLESVMAKREADLEALQARQRSLAARTSTATIDVVVRATASPEPTKPTKDDDGFVAGLTAGWDGLRTITTGLLTAVGAVLPFALVIGVLAVPATWLVRRLRRRRTAEA